MSINQNLGHATAYGYAKSKGYTGTEEEFAELMASYADVAQSAQESAEAAAGSATAAAGSATTAQTAAQTATTKASEASQSATSAAASASSASGSASTATTAASTATTKASDASQSATNAASSASTANSAADDATAAKTAAEAANTAAQSAKTAAQTAQTNAETAASSVSASAAQIATNTEDISELKNAFSYSDGGSLFNTIPLRINNSGETIIANFPVVSGHTYRIFVKTSINIGASAQVGLGYNGNTTVSASDLANGFTWDRLATVSNNESRVYITQTSGSVDGTVFAYVKDLGVIENEIPNLGYLSDPTTFEWYDGAINATNGVIDSYGSYLHSNLIKIDCNAEAVFNAVGLRFYDANDNYINAYKAGSTSQILDNRTYQYVKFVISGQDPTNFRVYSADTETPYKGLETVASAMRNPYNGTISAANNMNQFLTLVHVTDVHGDRVRFGRAVDFAKSIGADAIINTGDTVRYYGTDDFTFVTDKVTDLNIPYLQTVGNHEAQSMTSESAVYNKFIAPFVTANGYQLGGTGKPYYYVDFPSKSKRVIVINQYELYDGTMSVKLTGTELNWFCSTLLSTPANYGVIVCHHMPEVGIDKDTDHAEFYQEPYWNDATPAALTKIIDAFISGVNYSETLWGATVAADFAQKAAGVYFVAYLNGHQHQDRIGVVPNTNNRQVVLNAICTNAWFNINQNGTIGTSYPYYNELNDIGRLEKTPSQDAFNVYVIDTVSKSIKVARVGSDATASMTERKMMAIPYADL